MTGIILWQNRYPTAEEIAAREAEVARVAAAEAEDREFRMMRKIMKLMHRRLRGEITQAQYITQTDVIITKFNETN